MSATDQELAKFHPAVPIDDAPTPPSSWYADESFWQLDKEAVFSRSWQPVARVEQLQSAGSFVAGCYAGEPYVVTRTNSGALSALSNVCRHKAMQVASASGTASTLVCPYHGWSYDLDGRLRKAPRMAGVSTFDRETMSLPRLSVCQWGPWVFVNPEPNAAPIAELFPEIDARLRASGWDQLTFYQRKSWTIECNWKVYVDNYLDGGYHIPHMHPSLDAQIDMSSYRTELFTLGSIQSSGAKDGGDQRTEVDSETRIGEGAIYAWLFPSFMVNRYGPCMDSNWVRPLGKDRCEVVYEFYFDESSSEVDTAFKEGSIEQADLTQREDIAISESVQVGLNARSYDQGRYAPRVEVGEHHFHRLLHEAYTSARAGSAHAPRTGRS